jgi:hypothetical protein
VSFGDLNLADDDFDEPRRVRRRKASFDESVNKVLVDEVLLIDEAAAAARNADKTAPRVRIASRIFCHEFMASTWLSDGTGCHTVSTSVGPEGGGAGVGEVLFKVIGIHCGVTYLIKSLPLQGNLIK